MKTKNLLTALMLIIFTHLLLAQNSNINYSEANKSGNNELSPLLKYPKWNTLRNSGTQNDLSAISFADNNHGWIACTDGSIIYTEDGGTSWQEIYFGPSITFYDVYFINENTGFVAGTIDVGPSTRSIVYKTTDGGQKWQVSYLSENSMVLNSITFSDIEHGFISDHSISPYSSTGVLLTTNDCGESWMISSIMSICTRADNVTLDSENGKIWISGRMDVGPHEFSALFSRDIDGVYWDNYILSNNEMDFQSVDFSGTNGVAIQNDEGGCYIYLSSNSGEDWELIVMEPYEFNDVIFDENESLWLVGDNGLILSSDNFGVNWREDFMPGNMDINDICKTPGGYLWAIGDGGTIYSRQATEENQNTDAIFAKNSSTGL